ncbi:glycosyltransferase family 2 protein [Candidatus Nomurabacteria bacterium]|uniref:Glycosyltransferase family 2 protein n=1 Tax=candidate division WWE3 bacterium TaxID=2053526 RepID=A0A955IWZ5_UNCKA|nr:glycosyltransferase family 2 protein [candidate division WWE3 bacterium]MCB9824162.1 glycosyltransferase family 2 protein [Candidatus Nomurabacteria bacterium]MCB9826867.1 glycosyltransferase family 2 protein [Candidatus Nomurabacteria bacterium]MCB9828103.1 glycosyltransferase family 2 protein [Candidatus Nomurabacteria bacterium]HXK52453.1 glycosyltransferase family 2 protein [bacterium]
MKIVIVVPTYNEVENVGNLIPAIWQETKELSHDVRVLFVDGNSPDGTAEKVKEMSALYPFVSVILEPEKRGLGAAYIYAFKYAMSEMSADVVVEMDADFQHNPADIPRLIAALDAGADYAIGSRFAKGGSIPSDWALYRKLLSIGGSYFSKIVLGIFNVNDFTSGFRASRVRGFVDKIDLDSILSKGFAYKIDLLYKMHKLGAKITEVPIAFGLRDRGDSKMEKDNFQDSLKTVLTLRYRQNESFFKFLGVGLIGLFTDSALFNILYAVSLHDLLHMSSSVESLVSGFIAMFVTFTLNNFWSFSARKIGSKIELAAKLGFYYATSYLPIVFRSFLIHFSEQTFGESFFVRNGAFFIGIFIGLVWNFTIYSKVIWKKK